jgi:hypothetical protein
MINPHENELVSFKRLIYPPETAPTSSPFGVFDVAVDRGAVGLCGVSSNSSFLKACEKNTVGQALFGPLLNNLWKKYFEYLSELACW